MRFFVSLAAAAALTLSPAAAAPWQTLTNEQAGEELYTAYQMEPMGTALFLECYKPLQMVALGIQTGVMWDGTASHPSNVPLTFTIDGTTVELRNFNYEQQGTDTVLVSYHLDDEEGFEALYAALIAAQQSIVVEMGGPLDFPAEGVADATDWLMAKCLAE